MAGFIVVTSEGASLGFQCAGVETMEVAEDDDVTSTLQSLQTEGDYGIVILEEHLMERISEAVMRRIRKKGLPIIVPVAIPRQWEEREDVESPVMRLIRKAIGYQIKIKR
jgi:V/A-type H+-transporting ATPase subunit F